MKKDSAIARFFVLVFLGVFAIAIIIAFPLFLTNELDKQNQEFLKEFSAKNGESVGFKFQEQAAYLYYFAGAIDATKLDNPKAAIESIGDIPEDTHYKRYGIATLDGKAYTSDGKSIDLAHDEHIKECVEKDPGAFEEEAMVISVDDDDGDEDEGEAMKVVSAETALIEARIRDINTKIDMVGAVQRNMAGNYAGKVQGIMIGLAFTLIIGVLFLL